VQVSAVAAEAVVCSVQARRAVRAARPAHSGRRVYEAAARRETGRAPPGGLRDVVAWTALFAAESHGGTPPAVRVALPAAVAHGAEHVAVAA
jgi:hypothetical protein